MKSIHTDKFNHNDVSRGYDDDVADENNPVRTGYKELLEWMGEQTQNSNVLIDLGCGTGNTVLALNRFQKVYCVDISEKMIAIAKEKIKKTDNIVFIQEDLLAFFDNFDEKVDTVVSTYAIHHLTPDEKKELFYRIHSILKDDGKFICGDLMFENKLFEAVMRKKYPELVEGFDEEFFWDVEHETSVLTKIGFNVIKKRFSDLSWGIVADKIH